MVGASGGGDEASYWRNTGNLWELAKLRCLVLGWWDPEKGKWV